VIVDSFLYAGEYDMLELRYRTLRDVVDVFVPVACTVTHQGVPMDGPRLLLPPGNDDRYESPHDPKMRRPFVVAPPRMFADGQRSVAGQPFYQLIERQQRAGAWQAVWSQCHPEVNDVVMVSDVDEIPDPFHVTQFAQHLTDTHDRPFVCIQRFHSDRLPFIHPNRTWPGTTVTRWHNCDPHRQRQHRAQMVADGDTFETGWHFSWFGTDAERHWKLHAFSHGEVADAYDPRAGRNALIHSNGEPLLKVEAGDFRDWPRPLVDGTFTIPEAWLL